VKGEYGFKDGVGAEAIHAARVLKPAHPTCDLRAARIVGESGCWPGGMAIASAEFGETSQTPVARDRHGKGGSTMSDQDVEFTGGVSSTLVAIALVAGVLSLALNFYNIQRTNELSATISVEKIKRAAAAVE
jgi:hypothetical protein